MRGIRQERQEPGQDHGKDHGSGLVQRQTGLDAVGSGRDAGQGHSGSGQTRG